MKRKNFIIELKAIWVEYEEHYVLCRIISILYQKIFQFDIDVRAAAVAYNFTLAVFPTIIFLFTAIAYLPIKNLDAEILKQLEFVLPNNVYQTLQSTIKDIVKHQRGSLLSLGFVTAIFFSSNGFLSMIRAFNRYKKTKASPYKDRIKSILLTFLVFSILIISVTLIVYTTLSINWLQSKNLVIASSMASASGPPWKNSSSSLQGL